MILYIDMDGVVVDFNGGIRRYNPAIEMTVGDQVVPQNLRDEVDQICEKNPRIFLTLDPLPGAIDAVNKIQDSGKYEILFLSTPMWNVPESFMDKRLWLTNHFGNWVEKRLILSHRKDLNRGSILIDDTLRNGADKFTGHHFHFGTEKYPDWQSVLKLLL